MIKLHLMHVFARRRVELNTDWAGVGGVVSQRVEHLGTRIDERLTAMEEQHNTRIRRLELAQAELGKVAAQNGSQLALILQALEQQHPLPPRHSVVDGNADSKAA